MNGRWKQLRIGETTHLPYCAGYKWGHTAIAEDTAGSADEAFRYLWWNDGESTVHCYVSRNGTVELYLEDAGEIRYRECTNYAEAALLWEMAGE